MGYLIVTSLLAAAAYGWRSRASDLRFLARMSALCAVVVAVQMWWYL